MPSAVLDSWAVLALLDDEPAAPRVESIVESGNVCMSWINLGEVVYETVRRRGAERARVAVGAIRARIDAELPDEGMVLAAARIKARGGLSYADAFCVATARRHKAPLYTGDPEIIALDGDDLEVIDLRATR
ncbi:MAG: type II toxin-antitoxin system VapC family toxin [Conexibacter sp.]